MNFSDVDELCDGRLDGIFVMVPCGLTTETTTICEFDPSLASESMLSGCRDPSSDPFWREMEEKEQKRKKKNGQYEEICRIDKPLAATSKITWLWKHVSMLKLRKFFIG